MKISVLVACAAWLVSWFLPVLTEGQELKAMLAWTRQMKQSMAAAMPRLGQEGPFGAAGEADLAKVFDFQRSGPADSQFRGYDAARLTFDMLDDPKLKTTERIQWIWANLANPLFVLAACAALLGAPKSASVVAGLGLASAAWRRYGEHAPESSQLAIGYWLWLSSFAALFLAIVVRLTAGRAR